MNSPNPSKSKNLVIAVLALSFVGVGALAWNQYQQLIVLRTSALSPADVEALKRAKDDAEKKARELAAQLAAAQNNNRGQTVAANNNNTNQQNGRGGNNQQNAGQAQAQFAQQQAAMQAIMQTPEYQKAAASVSKANIEIQYAALFKNLGLPADQADQVKNLMVERSAAAQDIITAAQEAGVNGPALQKLISDSQSQSDEALRGAMGDAAYTQYQSYQSTLNQRQMVAQLAPTMALAGASLTDTQTEQLVQLMAQSGTFGRGGGAAGGAANFALAARAGAIGGGGGNTQITPAMLSAASSVLSPSQVEVLQQLSNQQRAASTMNQLTQSVGGGRIGFAGGTAAPAAAGARGGNVVVPATNARNQGGGRATNTGGQQQTQRRAGGG